MQLPGGGFSLWQGEQTVHPWGSVYATHFLVEARRAGHPVEDNLYRNAINWLAGEVKAKGTYGSEELERTVYGLYVLSRAGKADLGTMDFLRQKQMKNLPPQSRALLAASYAAAGNPRATQSLTANLGEVAEIQRQTGGNFDSAIRNRALLLLALMDADPKSPKIPALVDRLARDARNDSWWTTQEESFTLLALGQFIQRQAQQPPYSGTLLVGGKKIGAFDNKTVTFPAIVGGGTVQLRMNAGYKPGAAFYSVLTRGVPKDDAFQPASQGMEIQREFLDRDGKAIDLKAVKQGDLVAIKTKVRSVSRGDPQRGDRQSPPLGAGGGEPAAAEHRAAPLGDRRQPPAALHGSAGRPHPPLHRPAGRLLADLLYAGAGGGAGAVPAAAGAGGGDVQPGDPGDGGAGDDGG